MAVSRRTAPCMLLLVVSLPLAVFADGDAGYNYPVPSSAPAIQQSDFPSGSDAAAAPIRAAPVGPTTTLPTGTPPTSQTTLTSTIDTSTIDLTTSTQFDSTTTTVQDERAALPTSATLSNEYLPPTASEPQRQQQAVQWRRPQPQPQESQLQQAWRQDLARQQQLLAVQQQQMQQLQGHLRQQFEQQQLQQQQLAAHRARLAQERQQLDALRQQLLQRQAQLDQECRRLQQTQQAPAPAPAPTQPAAAQRQSYTPYQPQQPKSWPQTPPAVPQVEQTLGDYSGGQQYRANVNAGAGRPGGLAFVVQPSTPVSLSPASAPNRVVSDDAVIIDNPFATLPGAPYPPAGSQHIRVPFRT